MNTKQLVLKSLFILSFSLFLVHLPLSVKAQSEMEDVYDPFSDFSEFDESADQEADINFFKNGRLFNLGLLVGQRAYTEGLAQVYNPGVGVGFFLTYFFDLRFALQFSYLSSQGDYRVRSASYLSQGSSELTTYAINFKYYFNTQNVTRGLAQLNPYVIFGFSNHQRILSSSGNLNIGKDNAQGFDIGAGIEIPLLRNKMFIGLQIAYHVINFRDESTEITIQDEQTGKYGSGDSYSTLAVVGTNF
ncbi:MAG: outer membrane beta-barrel protein [Bdellovibrionales bacterium]